MRNSLLMAHAFCSTRPAGLANQAEAFKGDGDQLVDRLVVCCEKKQVDDSLLQERALVPFFEPSDSVNTSFEPLERRIKKTAPFQPPQHHGLKRNVGDRSGASLSSSPPAGRVKEAPASKHRRNGGKLVAQGAPQRGASHSDSELSSGTTSFQRAVSFNSDDNRSSTGSPALRGQRKHTRQPTAAQEPAVAPSQGRRSPSPPLLKREHPAGTPGAKFAPGKFAGPAFCNSPTPDSLPIPTTSLLLMV